MFPHHVHFIVQCTQWSVSKHKHKPTASEGETDECQCPTLSVVQSAVNICLFFFACALDRVYWTERKSSNQARIRTFLSNLIVYRTVAAHAFAARAACFCMILCLAINANADYSVIKSPNGRYRLEYGRDGFLCARLCGANGCRLDNWNCSGTWSKSRFYRLPSCVTLTTSNNNQ